MSKRLFARLYRHLHKNYPAFEGCGPCPWRPAPLARRRACVPAARFPVDMVYTWVDGNDRKHRAERERWLAGQKRRGALFQGIALFADNEELRYSLRSVREYAPWVRKIFILTDNQAPAWLNAEHGKISLADHRDCIPHEYLPTFNSHVIEPYLHRIPGLAEHFIYMNDDFFLASPSRPEDFFTPNGLPHLFMDWRYSRLYGYARAGTPHACSYANTRAFMKQQGYCLRDDPIVGHVPYAATKTNAEAALAFFDEPIRRFSPEKFRTLNQMAFYSHCLPYWSYTHKRAVPVDAPFYYINTGRFDRKVYYASMLREKGSGCLPLFFCLNDAGEPKPGDTRHTDMRNFLRAFFPDPCEFEKAESKGGGMAI